MVLRRDSDKFTRPMDHPETRREKWQRFTDQVNRLDLRVLLRTKKRPVWVLASSLAVLVLIVWVTKARYETAPLSVSVTLDYRQTEAHYLVEYRSQSFGGTKQEPLQASLGSFGKGKTTAACVAFDGGHCAPVGTVDSSSPISLIEETSPLPPGEWKRSINVSQRDVIDCDKVSGRCKAQFSLSSSEGRPIDDLKGTILLPIGTNAESVRVGFTTGTETAEATGLPRAFSPPPTSQNFPGLSKVAFSAAPQHSGLKLDYTVALSSIAPSARALAVFWIEWTAAALP